MQTAQYISVIFWTPAIERALGSPSGSHIGIVRAVPSDCSLDALESLSRCHVDRPASALASLNVFFTMVLQHAVHKTVLFTMFLQYRPRIIVLFAEFQQHAIRKTMFFTILLQRAIHKHSVFTMFCTQLHRHRRSHSHQGRSKIEALLFPKTVFLQCFYNATLAEACFFYTVSATCSSQNRVFYSSTATPASQIRSFYNVI